jgi:hypothetical protein
MAPSGGRLWMMLMEQFCQHGHFYHCEHRGYEDVAAVHHGHLNFY